jgi:hypothetical protein
MPPYNKAGYTLTGPAIERVKKWLRQTERKPVARPAAIRPIARGGDGFPLRLAKPQSGETLDGSTPGTSALCSIYAATPGSETAMETDVPVYPGQAMGTSNTIDDTTYFLCGDVNGVLQFVGPVAGGGGSSSSGGMVVVELPSDLAKTDATKASCTVKQTFSGGPAVSSTVTITNPDAKGGNYQFRAESTTQYVNAIWQGGSTYLVCGTQPVAFDPVDDVAWTSPDLEQTKRDIDIGYSGSTATTTVLTGDPTCPTP